MYRNMDIEMIERMATELFKLCDDCSCMQNTHKLKVKLPTFCINYSVKKDECAGLADEEFDKRLDFTADDLIVAVKREMEKICDNIYKCENMEISFTPEAEINSYMWFGKIRIIRTLQISIELELVMEVK